MIEHAMRNLQGAQGEVTKEANHIATLILKRLDLEIEFAKYLEENP